LCMILLRRWKTSRRGQGNSKKMRSIFWEPPIQTKVIVYSHRKYGQPKLIKPKELKGIKQSFSVDWIPKKCKCSCFIHDNNLYIKHRDFNSVEIYGHDHEFKKKFVYNDTFGSAVLRGEAWLLLKDLVVDIRNNIFPPRLSVNLAEQTTGEVGNYEWERFFDKIIREISAKRNERG
jgi:hypothetical protein